MALASPLPRIEIPVRRPDDHARAVRQIREGSADVDALSRSPAHSSPLTRSSTSTSSALAPTQRYVPGELRGRGSRNDHDMDAIARYSTPSPADEIVTVRVSSRLRCRLLHSTHGLRDFRHHDGRHLPGSARSRYATADEIDYFLDTPPFRLPSAAPSSWCGDSGTTTCRSNVRRAHVHRGPDHRRRLF